jgi:hypothetical protein
MLQNQTLTNVFVKFSLLKGLLQEIFRPVFSPVLLHLGVNVIKFCF